VGSDVNQGVNPYTFEIASSQLVGYIYIEREEREEERNSRMKRRQIRHFVFLELSM
jgi:hypothetical protein